MRTNLIQSYLYDNKITQQYNSNIAQKDFDIHKELANRTFIKPLPSNGELVRNSIFDTPSELFKDYKYNLKALKHAIKGDAKDHELGVINDLGMKFGGLAIASFLLTKKQAPMAKIMEFIGLTAFFGAMDIWPKLALQLPASLIHGFNIRQKYRDNIGTKKMVFQDHQFIPWDLYSDKEINKIGDRLGVPKDMKNRRDFIQEKMRKIALQNNTMWMLTAGFATPIMSALICNAAEEPLKNWVNKNTSKRANAYLSQFERATEKIKYPENTMKLKNLLETYKGKPLSPQIIKEIGSVLSEGFDPTTSNALIFDLENLAGKRDSYNIDKEVVNKISDLLANKFKSDEKLKQIIPDSETLLKSFEENGLIKDGVTDFSSHIKFIQKVIETNAKKIYPQNSDILQRVEIIMDGILTSNTPKKDSALKSILKSKSSNVLTDTLAKNIFEISKVIQDFRAKNTYLQHYAYLKAAQAPETVLANSWNKLANELPEIFEISKEEIEQARYDRIMAGKLLRSKIEKIVSNDEKYSKVIGILQRKLSDLYTSTSFGDSNPEKLTETYRTRVNQTYDVASSALEKLNMPTLVRRLIGYQANDASSLKNLQLSFVTDRVRGVRNSFYQLLNTLDVYYRISKVENLDVLGPEMPREMKEELVELCKQTLIDGHTSDYSEKLYSRRNPDLNKAFNNKEERKKYVSQIETEQGKVINKVIQKRDPKKLAELSNDKNFFLDAMKLMYGGDIHPNTHEKIHNNSLIYEKFIQYRQDMYRYFGGAHNFAKPFHQLDKSNEIKSSSEFKFLLKGCALDEMFLNLFKNKFNSNKWLKTFGIFGATLFGITFIAQFFTGHTNKYKKAAIKENT